jgi:microcin C transport system substrate-binding protein
MVSPMIAYLLSLCLAFSVAYGQTTAISLYGTPKYKPLFTHFDYVNPNAPVGGTLRIGVVGTFTTLNPFNLKGQAPEAVQLLCTERLFDRSGD